MEQIGQNKIMADVCRGLSQICKMLSKEKEKEEKMKSKLKKKKLSIVKKHKMDKIVKIVETENSKQLNKFANDFEKKAKVFKEFAKLHDKKEKEVKKEWKKIKNQK